MKNFSLKSMSKIFSLLAVVTLFSVIYLNAGDAKLQMAEVNKPAPNFTLKDSKGKSHNLTDFKGKYVVLEWVNYDCPFVKKHYDSNNMQALQKEFTSKGVVWLSICSSAPGKQGNFDMATIASKSSEYKVSHTAYLLDEDGFVGKQYGAKTTPHCYVVNPQGVLMYAGAIDDNPSAKPEDAKGAKNYVREALNSLMNGKAVETPSTKAYGCSVKYEN